MKPEADNFYHIYNRGINKCKLFYSDRNYWFFINKMREYICPHCSLIAYTLMPNHFHLIIHANENTEKMVIKGSGPVNVLSEGLRIMLSSYSQAINQQLGRVGNLFQQNTKNKILINDPGNSFAGVNMDYLEYCFHYVHNNASKAGIVMSPLNWPYSSFHEYFGKPSLRICDVELARKYIDLISYEKLHLPFILNV